MIATSITIQKHHHPTPTPAAVIATSSSTIHSRLSNAQVLGGAGSDRNIILGVIATWPTFHTHKSLGSDRNMWQWSQHPGGSDRNIRTKATASSTLPTAAQPHLPSQTTLTSTGTHPQHHPQKWLAVIATSYWQWSQHEDLSAQKSHHLVVCWCVFLAQFQW